MGESHEYVIDADRRKLFDWQEIWRYRELFYFFAWRDVKIKYKQTVLGFLWAVLQPLFMMLIFTFFFGRALDIPTNSIPYPVFVFSGLLIWTMFSSGLTNAANSMVNNAMIIKKIYFPRLIIPTSAILVACFDFFIAFILFVPVLIYFDQSVSMQAIWCWPLALLTAVVATLGPGCFLAALNVKYRDFRHVIPFLVQVWFFISPVLYPATMLKYEVLRYLLALSPVYAAVEFFRIPIQQQPPDLHLISISIISGLFLLGVGLLYFKRSEHFFADVV